MNYNFWKIKPTLRNGKRDNSKSPVFLAHGLTASSAQWVFGPPEKSLGYILADAGEYGLPSQQIFNAIRIFKDFFFVVQCYDLKKNCTRNSRKPEARAILRF